MNRLSFITSFLFLILSLQALGAHALAASGNNYSISSFSDGLQAGSASGGGYDARFALTAYAVAAGAGGGYNASIGLYNVTVAAAPVQATSVPSTSSGSGSSGGGGGGGGALPLHENIQGTVATSDSRLLSNVAQGQTVEYETRNNLTISRIVLHFSEYSELVRINLREFKSKPDNIPAVEHPYKYFYIEHQGLDSVDSRSLEFKVPKAWLAQQGASRVILYRLESDSWKPYDAQRVREDGDVYYYNATLPGFSYIAIGVKQEVAAAPVTPAASQVPAATQASPQAQTPAEQQAAPANEQPSQVSLPEVASGSSVWIVLGIIAGVLIIGVVGIAQYKRRNARKPQTAQMASQPQQGGSVPQQSVQVAPDSIVERVPEHDPANAVHQYILQMRARGATEQEIRTRLLTVGWDELVIDMEMMRR